MAALSRELRIPGGARLSRDDGFFGGEMGVAITSRRLTFRRMEASNQK